MTMIWESKDQRGYEALGFIPQFVSSNDMRPVAEQFNECYAHGGGWRPFKGFEMDKEGNITYPGEPTYKVLAESKLRGEIIRVYAHGWVSITQPDGSYEISRMD